jgi:hypothetical protein
MKRGRADEPVALSKKKQAPAQTTMYFGPAVQELPASFFSALHESRAAESARVLAQRLESDGYLFIRFARPCCFSDRGTPDQVPFGQKGISTTSTQWRLPRRAS